MLSFILIFLRPSLVWLRITLFYAWQLHLKGQGLIARKEDGA
jgi:hypothetical protein